MTLLTGATAATMLQMTGGVVVVDVASSESSYGHFDQVPFDFGGDGRVITTEPSVVVATSAFTFIGPKAGVGRALTVAGASWTVRDIVPADEDGGTIRLMLAAN